MRLSDLLTKAPDITPAQIEGFLDDRPLRWGKHKRVRVGKVLHNSYCRWCNDLRTFTSGDELYCLGLSSNSVSIDATLRCPGQPECPVTVEAWFLVGCEGDIFARAPVVFLERYSENQRASTDGIGVDAEQFEDLLARAHIAYGNHLGAGAMVYLRKIFEAVTTETAKTLGVATTGPNGGRKPFKFLLEEVDRKHHIIPTLFSNNGYQLFSELSEVIHGDSNEDDALKKYLPCRQLVLSVINNIKEDRQTASAIEALGWKVENVENVVRIASEGIAS